MKVLKQIIRINKCKIRINAKSNKYINNKNNNANDIDK